MALDYGRRWLTYLLPPLRFITMTCSTYITLLAALIISVSGSIDVGDTVRLSADEYTELYKKAFQKDEMTSKLEKINEEKQRMKKEAHQQEIEMIRKIYAKKWVQNNIVVDTPTWLTEQGVVLSRSNNHGNWMPLHSSITATWNHTAGTSSPAIFNFDVYFRVYSKKWTVIPYVFIL